MKNRLYAVAVASLCLAGSATAQTANTLTAPSQPVAADTLAARTTQASLIDRPSVAVRRADLTSATPLPASGGKNLGEAKAEMAVGGAAIVVGALIGGDGGSVVMFGGALVGLYGLWNYLK